MYLQNTGILWQGLAFVGSCPVVCPVRCPKKWHPKKVQKFSSYGTTSWSHWHHHHLQLDPDHSLHHFIFSMGERGKDGKRITLLIKTKLFLAMSLGGGSRSQRGVGGWLPCVMSMPSAGYSQRVSAACHRHPALAAATAPTPGRRRWAALPLPEVPAVQMILSPGFVRAVALV